MVKTPSNMPPLGLVAPNFTLPTPDGTLVHRDECKGPEGLLVIFMCNHCPFVVHLQHALAEKTAQWMKQGLGVVGINANDITTHPDDSPKHMARVAKEIGYTFPYLFDETQATARAYHAACTPDFFLFDERLVLTYRGRFDSSTPGNSHPITGDDLTHAVESLLNRQPHNRDQHPSIGCNIKWRAV